MRPCFNPDMVAIHMNPFLNSIEISMASWFSLIFSTMAFVGSQVFFHRIIESPFGFAKIFFSGFSRFLKPYQVHRDERTPIEKKRIRGRSRRPLKMNSCVLNQQTCGFVCSFGTPPFFPHFCWLISAKNGRM